MIIRMVIALVLATMMHFTVGCGDPCMDADYTTSGLCVHLNDYDLTADDVDFVVALISDVANLHGLHDVDMAQRLNDVGPVPLTMVPFQSLGTDDRGIPVVGMTHYAVLAEWGNDRLSGYSIEVEDGQELEQRLLTVAHELLHIMGPEYIGTNMKTNLLHSEPYMFRAWGLYYDLTYSPRHTVEGISWTYIREYLGLNDE